jgi:hypothetical protein
VTRGARLVALWLLRGPTTINDDRNGPTTKEQLRGPFRLFVQVIGGSVRGLIIRCSRARNPRDLLRAARAWQHTATRLHRRDSDRRAGGRGEIKEPSFEILNSGATRPLPVTRLRPVPAQTPIRGIRSRVLDRQVPAPGTNAQVRCPDAGRHLRSVSSFRWIGECSSAVRWA